MIHTPCKKGVQSVRACSRCVQCAWSLAAFLLGNIPALLQEEASDLSVVLLQVSGAVVKPDFGHSSSCCVALKLSLHKGVGGMGS